MKWTLGMLFGALVSVSAGAALADGAAPYAGWQQRDIKALSAQQIDDLLAGRGMSLALAAELNGYPGPRHVLDLADALDLTPDQRAAVAAQFSVMQGEAQRIGAEIVAEEAALDHAFRSRRADEAGLRARLARLGALRGALRRAHLRSHLATRAVLGEAQAARYAALRGYAAAPDAAPDAVAPHAGHGSAPAQP